MPTAPYEPATSLTIEEWTRRHQAAAFDPMVVQRPSSAAVGPDGATQGAIAGLARVGVAARAKRNAICEVCGGPISSLRSHSRYCTGAHRQRAYRDRHREAA
jgi:hypothetical protein